MEPRRHSKMAESGAAEAGGKHQRKKITLEVPVPVDTAVETYCLVTGTPKNEAAVIAFREFIKKHEKDTLRRLSALRANTTAAAAGV
jgi:hypothetical protein